MRSLAAILERTRHYAAVGLPADYLCLYNKISGAKIARVECYDYLGEKMSTLSIQRGDVSPFGLSGSKPLHPSTGSGRTDFWSKPLHPSTSSRRTAFLSKPLHPSTGSGRTAFLSTASVFPSFPKWSRKYVAKFPACALAVTPY